MQDLTAITTPFGLLDPETQAAMKAHGGPLEIFTVAMWVDSASAHFDGSRAYRAKPVPPKPREWWCVLTHMHDSEAEAVAFRDECRAAAPNCDFGPIIHVREALPD